MRLLSVVLSGDSYSGLWPLSRQASPKPFMKLGGSTLLQKAIERGQASGATDLLIVTNASHQFLTKDVLSQMSSPPSTTMLLHPKDPTAGSAIALAALQCARQFSPETTMLVLSADHLVPDVEGFVASASEALKLAEQGKIAVFGVSPTSPDTGVGYVEVETASREIQPAKRFVGKPNLQTAQEYLASGRHYWNSAIACFKAGTMIAALEKHAPELLEAARRALDSSVSQGDSIKFDLNDLASHADIGIDDMVMARADNVHVVPANFSWSDARAWPAVTASHASDASGNTMPPEAIAIDTTGTHVQVESHGPKVVATLGIHDLVVVDTPDALLVAHKESAHDVHKIVTALKQRKHDAIDLPATVHRPWGTYASLKEEPGYKVKRITVKPGQSLSLQYHHQRAEHWVVVKGTAIVQVGDVEYKTLPGEYRYIPLEERHRLTNVGQDELVLVEVQCGAYLGEDDIVRLADTYGRA